MDRLDSFNCYPLEILSNIKGQITQNWLFRNAQSIVQKFHLSTLKWTVLKGAKIAALKLAIRLLFVLPGRPLDYKSSIQVAKQSLNFNNNNKLEHYFRLNFAFNDDIMTGLFLLSLLIIFLTD